MFFAPDLPRHRSTRLAAVAALLLIVSALGLALPPAARAGLSPEEENERIEEVRQWIARHDLHWTAGHTSVSGLTREEMQSRLGLIIPPEWGGDPFPTGKPRADLLRVPWDSLASAPGAAVPPTTLPSVWDWRELNGVTPVKDQGDCGSCWAFSATAAFESAILIHSGREVDLSEQQLLSCNLFGYGCDGGWMTAAYKHFERFGAVTEECMPYAADDTQPCIQTSCAERHFSDGYHGVISTTRDLKIALLDGPFAVAMAVEEDLFTYTGGCYSHPDPGPVNHAVLLVGWDDTMCDGDGAWIIKNSWGTAWGVEGYLYLKFNSCSIGFGGEQLAYTPEEGVVIAHTVLDDQPHGVGTVEFRATVRSAGGVLEPGSPVLNYRLDGGEYAAVVMFPGDAPDEYGFEMTEEAVGTTLEYYIHATDDQGHEQTHPLAAPARLHSIRFGHMVAYEFAGELGTEGWSHAPGMEGFGDQWHLSSERNHTPAGSHCWKCGPIGPDNYDGLLDAALQTPAFTLPDWATLRFFHWIDAEESPFEMGLAYDGGIVEISTDGGQVWEQVMPINGWPYRSLGGSIPGPFPEGIELFSGTEDWREERFDLRDYNGNAMLRFRFGSDGSVAFQGWCIDDVEIIGFAPGAPPAPVELLGIEGVWSDNSVRLEWQVADPTAVAGFHVERGPASKGPYERRTNEILSSSSGQIDPRDPAGEPTFRFIDSAPATWWGAIYRLIQVEWDGSESPLGSIEIFRGVQAPQSRQPRLLPNIPNPFKETTTLRFELPASHQREPVYLDIYDLQGRLVARPVLGERLAGGVHLRPWDGRDLTGTRLSAGAYFLKLRTGAHILTRGLSLIW